MVRSPPFHHVEYRAPDRDAHTLAILGQHLLSGQLARKGYSGEVAWPIISDTVDSLPEHRRD